MDKLILETEMGNVPTALCGIDRYGGIDDIEGCGNCHGEDDFEADCEKCAVQKCFDRLKQYEDTGLTPDQIWEIDKLYTEKCEEVAVYEDVRRQIENNIEALKESKDYPHNFKGQIVETSEWVLSLMNKDTRKRGKTNGRHVEL